MVYNFDLIKKTFELSHIYTVEAVLFEDANLLAGIFTFVHNLHSSFDEMWPATPAVYIT